MLLLLVGMLMLIALPLLLSLLLVITGRVSSGVMYDEAVTTVVIFRVCCVDVCVCVCVVVGFVAVECCVDCYVVCIGCVWVCTLIFVGVRVGSVVVIGDNAIVLTVIFSVIVVVATFAVYSVCHVVVWCWRYYLCRG